MAAEYTLFDKLLGLLAPQKCLYCGYPTDENGKAVCESCKKLEKELRQYGFDQAALLAKCLSDELNVPVCPALCRSREKPPQKLLSAAQRRRNIRDSFTVKAGILGDAQNALLVDDVVTTGATVDECAALLRKAGVKTVHIACIAKTPNYFLH